MKTTVQTENGPLQIEFIARVDVEKDAKGEDRNVVKLAIEPDHKDYTALMGGVAKTVAGTGHATPAAPIAPARPTPASATGKPSWAQ